MIFNSLRWRLQLWYGLVLLLVLAGFGITAYELERGRVFGQINGELDRRLGALDESLRAPDARARDHAGPGHPRSRGEMMSAPGSRSARGLVDGPPPLDAPAGLDEDRPPADRAPRTFQLSPRFDFLFDQADTNSFYFAVWSRDGALLSRSANAPLDLARPVVLAGRPPRSITRGFNQETFRATPPGEILLVGKNIHAELAGLRATAGWLALLGGGTLALGLLGGWWTASRAIRPVNSISATAARIASGDLSQRIDPGDTETELGRLASVLNSTFARLETAFTQQKQFTGDAAHELRTPVSVMLTQTQSTLARERSAEEYRESLEACLRAARRMRSMIESLLELTGLDSGAQAVNRVRFDLAAVARDCLEEILPLARERGIGIHADLHAAEFDGDPDRMAQVVTNLLSNAIHYNRPDGTVRLTTETIHGSVRLIVADTGIGISSEELPRIFKRFYRVEKSRSDGRSGLGLSIAKALVEAQGGTIEATSKPGQGSVFTVCLPSA